MNVLEIDRLTVRYGDVAAVRDFSLAIEAGECVGVVGESGAGKSQAFLAAMGLLSSDAQVTGNVRFAGEEILNHPVAQLNRLRGASLTMIFQDPLTSLTPHMKIVDQIAEPLVRHRELSWKAARGRALELLTRVHVTDPARRLNQYPHELSGGMRQRVMIAAALACGPKLVIADEPTTALDVTIQAQILALLAELKREQEMSLVLITHDFGTVAGLADRVVVMQGGRIVEQGQAAAILKAPSHPYTQTLLHAVPSLVCELRAEPLREDESVLLKLSQLGTHFKTLRALDDIGFDLKRGEALGVVGESGSGKSTLARAVLQLLKPTSGHVVWLGRRLDELSASQLKPLRRDLQIVFQDPLASLDPRMKVGEIVTEPLRVHRPELDREARLRTATEMLDRVALSADLLQRYPHELSGGQAQRVGIARAMILKPKLLICDEAVSALDVATQAQIVELLRTLRREDGLTLIFISHNLAVVRQLCDRVLVLYLGRMMELALTSSLYESPLHPYTQGLLDAIPLADPDLQPARLSRTLEGELPSPLAPPSGCVFHTRCPHAIDICRMQRPVWESVDELRQVACHRWKELNVHRAE